MWCFQFAFEDALTWQGLVLFDKRTCVTSDVCNRIGRVVHSGLNAGREKGAHGLCVVMVPFKWPTTGALVCVHIVLCRLLCCPSPRTCHGVTAEVEAPARGLSDRTTPENYMPYKQEQFFGLQVEKGCITIGK